MTMADRWLKKSIKILKKMLFLLYFVTKISVYPFQSNPDIAVSL